MFSENTVLILQQLSYLVIIFTGPAIIYFAVKTIILDVRFSNHLEQDASFHKEISVYVGRHFSQIHDLQVDMADLRATVKNGNGHL